MHDRVPKGIGPVLAGAAGTTYLTFKHWKTWIKKAGGDVALAIEAERGRARVASARHYADPENAERHRVASRAWRAENLEKERERSRWAVRAWRADPANAGYDAHYQGERSKIDPLFATTKRIRSAVKDGIRRGGTKRLRTEELLGCSIAEAREHLLRTWQGLTVAGAAIDHFVPCASARSQEELEALSHVTNLRLMTAEANGAKGDRVPTPAELSEWEALLGRAIDPRVRLVLERAWGQEP